MATILNKTSRPLQVPLPGKKLLRLAPHKSGEVNVKALQHPPLLAMVEAGEIEITEERKGRTSLGGGTSKGPAGSSRPNAGPEIRRTGER